MAVFLLLHGVPTDRRLWDGVSAALLDHGHRVWAPDLPGYGATPALDRAALTLRGHQQWLEEARPPGLPSWSGMHLVGHDYGGLLATHMATRLGAASLTLSSTALGPGWIPAKLMALPLAHRLFYRRYGGRLWLERAALPDHRAAWMDRFGPNLDAPGLADHMAWTARGIQVRGLAALVPALRRPAFPIRCIWGDQDRFYPLGRALAAALGARWSEIQDAAHAVPFEQPRAFTQALLADLPTPR